MQASEPLNLLAEIPQSEILVPQSADQSLTVKAQGKLLDQQRGGVFQMEGAWAAAAHPAGGDGPGAVLVNGVEPPPPSGREASRSPRDPQTTQMDADIGYLILDIGYSHWIMPYGLGSAKPLQRVNL